MISYRNNKIREAEASLLGLSDVSLPEQVKQEDNQTANSVEYFHTPLPLGEAACAPPGSTQGALHSQLKGYPIP